MTNILYNAYVFHPDVTPPKNASSFTLSDIQCARRKYRLTAKAKHPGCEGTVSASQGSAVRCRIFVLWVLLLASTAMVVTLSVARTSPDFLEAASSANLPGMAPASALAATQKVEPYAESIWDTIKPSERAELAQLLKDSDYLQLIRRDIVNALMRGNGYEAVALVSRTYHVKKRLAQIAIELISQTNGEYVYTHNASGGQNAGGGF